MDSTSVLDFLVRAGLISSDDVNSAKSLQTESGGQLFETLVRIGAIDEDSLLKVVSDIWHLPVFDGDQLPSSGELVTDACGQLSLSRQRMNQMQAIVWWAARDDGEAGPRGLRLAARNPFDPQLRETIDRALDRYERTHGLSGTQLEAGLIARAQLESLLAFLPSDHGGDDPLGADSDLARLRELAEEAPIIDLVNQVFAAAIKHRASDIHFEPYDKSFDIRFRVDGVIQTWQRQPRSRFDAVSTRIKLISNMDISERRLPQDGRQSIRLSGQQFDLRVSSLPGAWGESLVLRLLKKDKTLPSLDELGLTGRSRAAFSSLIRSPDGIILITGPTGSGKSTTLYKGLDEINDGQKKIITIEDPIEFDMARVTQTQVKADIGYTFAKGLRSILRQDPDVIMIGEIRDGETAAIAVQASLTGHLVLSTLHTNSSLLAISRLRDLGLDPFLIGSAVKALAAQRLVRRLCPHCARSSGPPTTLGVLESACAEETRNAIYRAVSPANWQEAKGCDACTGTGYLGRIALFEIVAIDDELRDLILSDASPSQLEAAARRHGFRRLAEDGLEKAAQGLTTVAEVIRAAVGQVQSGLHDEMET